MRYTRDMLLPTKKKRKKEINGQFYTGSGVEGHTTSDSDSIVDDTLRKLNETRPFKDKSNDNDSALCFAFPLFFSLLELCML